LSLEDKTLNDVNKELGEVVEDGEREQEGINTRSTTRKIKEEELKKKFQGILTRARLKKLEEVGKHLIL